MSGLPDPAPSALGAPAQSPVQTLAASKIGSVRFGVQINNLFNTEYCNNGYGYSSIVGGVREDSAFYFPQAMFNVLANVTVRF